MARIKTWFDAWIARRSPPSTQVRLSNRNIYILPSRAGWLLIGMLIILLLMAINYQNSLIFGLCFWLGSVFAVLIWHTWSNLASLTISVGEEVAGFVGEKVSVGYTINPLSTSPHYNVKIRWRDYPDESTDSTSLMTSGVDIESKAQHVNLTFQISQRGWNSPPRLEVYTRYPLGILTAWSVIQLQSPILGYPNPVFGVSPHGQMDEGGEDDLENVIQQASRQAGSDFDSLSPYVQGDSLKKVDWKRFAKTEELVTKTFVAPPVSNSWLRFDDFYGLTLEDRLSALAGWVVEWSDQRKVFGLLLPQVQIAPGSGEQHKIECLRALALFGVVDSMPGSDSITERNK
jgi:uncharacterized protein (DUF58 family)